MQPITDHLILLILMNVHWHGVSMIDFSVAFTPTGFMILVGNVLIMKIEIP